MRITYRIILYAFGLFIIISCVDEIETKDFNKEYEIVINCFFNSDSSFKAYISKSYNPYGIDNFYYVPDSILNAEIKIFENDKFLCNLTHSHNGIYVNHAFYPREGNNYRIEVVVDDIKAYAESYVPEKVSIKNITVDTAYFDDFGQPISWGIPHYKLHFDDPKGYNNYLLTLYSYHEDSYSQDNIVPIHFSSKDPVIGSFDSFYKDDGETFFIFSDKLFEENPYILDFRIDEFNCFTSVYSYVNELTINVLLNNISMDLAQYIQSYNKYEKTSNNPLAEPSPIYTNVTDGLGIFAGYNSFIDTIKIYRNKN